MKTKWILRILGFVFLTLGIFFFALSMAHFGDFDHEGPDYFMIGSMLGPVFLFAGIVCLVMGFRTAIMKASINMAKEYHEENKDTLKDIADINAEIHKDAVGTIVKEVADTINQSKVFCKHCGASIDSDSKFCSKCGKEV